MKIFYAPSGTEGSYFYRHYLPAKYMQGIHQVHIKHRASYQDFRDYDLIIMQSQWSLSQKGNIQALQAQGKKVVFEIDDNIWDIPHGNESRNYWTPDKLQDIKEMFTICDAIITTTKPLAALLRQFNSEVYVIPNYVEDVITEAQRLNCHSCEGRNPEEILKKYTGFLLKTCGNDRESTNDKIVRIGYAGSISHAPDFTPEIIRALKDIKIKYRDKVQFVFLGYMPDALRITQYDIEYHDYVQPLQYMEALQNLHLNIGIIPCEINSFNSCKSNLKFLEYSIAGAATIASPVTPYLDTIKDGLDGYIVNGNSYDSWFHALSVLIEKEKLRTDIAMYANAFVKNYLIKNKISEIDAVYKKIMRKKGVRV